MPDNKRAVVDFEYSSAAKTAVGGGLCFDAFVSVVGRNVGFRQWGRSCAFRFLALLVVVK